MLENNGEVVASADEMDAFILLPTVDLSLVLVVASFGSKAKETEVSLLFCMHSRETIIMAMISMDRFRVVVAVGRFLCRRRRRKGLESR